MHEFSIAMSIIEIAETEAAANNSKNISAMELDIGTMAGIEYYALDTALEMAVKDTMLENAKISVNKISAIARCSDCKHEFEIMNVTDTCPKCSSFFNEVITGKELKIRSIIIDE
jgi:hydrogenase nickel incorporation protein HypA/HybF